MQDIEYAREALGALARMGVRIALDDFGTGYSSLAHLMQFPVDIIKIDKSFVNQVEGPGRGQQIVAAVTAMAHVLGMTVVAEGIENSASCAGSRTWAATTGRGTAGRPLRPEIFAQRLGSAAAAR